MADPLKSIRLHHEGIDWSDPEITVASIGKRLMGPCPYLAGLSVEDAAKKEIEILKEAKPSGWAGQSEWKPYYQHFLTLIKLLLPRRDITTNLADAVMFFCLATGNRRKGVNFIGSQNSGKSSATAIIALTCLAISPYNTACYVANPFDAAADSTIWGDVLETFEAIRESSPWLWPNAKVYEDRSIEVIRGVPKAALIELRGVKEVGKFKGMKTVKNRPGEPLLLVSIDEVNEIKNQAFLQILANISSQDGFLFLTSQNFTSPDNMGGQLCAPKALFAGCPGSYRELDKDRDHFWNSHLSSYTLRFNGENSPNILSGRTLYPYLFTQANLDFQKNNYGPESPEYYSQVLSFPTVGGVTTTVLSQERWENSRCEDTEFTIERILGRVAFCDPAFGGGDQAKWGFADFGYGISATGPGGQRETHSLLIIQESFDQLYVRKDEKVTREWLVRARNVGVDHTQFILDDLLTPEEQVAIQCAELNFKHLIRPDSFGYDFSMRHEIVTTLGSVIGSSVVPFSYNDPPHGHYLHAFQRESKDMCPNRVSELAFLTADLFMLRQVRGGRRIRKAVEQLTQTRYEIKAKKYHVESKKEYKARFNNKSPDDRDVLMGLIGMAHLRGFRPKQLSAGQTAPGIEQVAVITNPHLRRGAPMRLKR